MGLARKAKKRKPHDDAESTRIEMYLLPIFFCTIALYFSRNCPLEIAALLYLCCCLSFAYLLVCCTYLNPKSLTRTVADLVVGGVDIFSL